MFQRALLACTIAGGCLSLIGIVVIQFQLTVVRFALMHLSLLGGALGMLIGTKPMWGAMVAIVIGSLLFGPLSSKINLEPAITGAFLMTGSLAAALMLFHVGGVPAMEVFGLFAGSILTLTALDFWLLGIVSLIIVSLFTLFYREIQLVLHDADQAQWLGVPVSTIRNSLLFLTGIAIGISMKLVGALLIDALLLLPAMAATRIAKTYKQLLVFSVLFGLICAVGGFILSLLLNLPTGATITMFGVLLLGICYLLKRK
ncbi:metal ABC transporter permease [Paenibacillus luteus]|uniref:metal ABC transporter permease n=1 Tax=Paenibacillus luteus TaxID=2545753 RepID=UPI00240DA416|nr:metal ABC transporter permease [Paenibacillus luteus]